MGLVRLADAVRETQARLTALRETAMANGSAAPRRPSSGDDSAADECPICKGAGFLRMPYEPNRGQRLVPCSCMAEERRERWIARMIETSGLTPRMRRRTFATWEAYTPALAEVAQVAREYAESPDGWLVLYGGVGCGKSHLAVAITWALLERGVAAYYQVVPDLLRRVRETFGADAEETTAALWDRLERCDVLILDDLGAERANEWVRELLYQVIDARYRAEAPTVVVSNLSPQEIGGRIGSRLLDADLCTVVQIAASDYRQRGGE